jgi:arylsulfatase A-like enzyme
VLHCKSTRIPTLNPRHRIVLLAGVLALGCQHGPDVWHGERRFDELLHAPSASRASTAGSAWVTIDNESRAVIARPITLVHADGVRIEQPGPQSYRAHELDGIGAPLPAMEAMVRPVGGEWQPRSVSIAGAEAERSVAVAYTAADTTQPVELVVNTWLPPLPLDVSSAVFRVPARARLRFGTGVRAVVPVQARFRVSIQRDAGQPEILSAALVDSADPAVGWHDVDVDVTPYAGQEVRLRFEASLNSSVALAGAPFPPPRAVVSAPLLVVPQVTGDPAYNLIVVSIDTLRADHVGAYGYRRPISPSIDRLAAGGTVFENVFAVWPETSASHMTLFTGLYPSVHGIGIMKWGAAALPPWQLTLAEILREQGFVTGAVTEDGLLSAGAGFPRGFHTYREFLLRTPHGPIAARNPVDALPVAVGHLGEAQQVFATGAEWVRRHAGDRFFLFLHTYQVHQRNAPGARYAALRKQFVTDKLTPPIPSADGFLATYDAAIAYTDEQLEGFLRTVAELKLTAHTIVIVTSDHGEEFYEHGVFGHGTTLYDPALRVPLVLSCPGVIPAGRRVGQQISLIDLFPTILDLLRVPPVPHVQGRSVAGLLTKQADAAPAPIVCELGDERRALRTARWKLIRTHENGATRVELYDLQNDPGETHAVPTEGSADGREALRILSEHDLESGSVRDQLQAAAPGLALPAAVDLDEHTRERLRALGYEAPTQRSAGLPER